MHVALALVSLALVVIGVAGIATRLGASAPLALVGVGAVGAYLPFVPDVRLEPELVLVGILPPLLYAAAIRTSLVDFRASRLCAPTCNDESSHGTWPMQHLPHLAQSRLYHYDTYVGRLGWRWRSRHERIWGTWRDRAAFQT